MSLRKQHIKTARVSSCNDIRDPLPNRTMLEHEISNLRSITNLESACQGSIDANIPEPMFNMRGNGDALVERFEGNEPFIPKSEILNAVPEPMCPVYSTFDTKDYRKNMNSRLEQDIKHNANFITPIQTTTLSNQKGTVNESEVREELFKEDHFRNTQMQTSTPIECNYMPPAYKPSKGQPVHDFEVHKNLPDLTREEPFPINKTGITDSAPLNLNSTPRALKKDNLLWATTKGQQHSYVLDPLNDPAMSQNKNILIKSLNAEDLVCNTWTPSITGNFVATMAPFLDAVKIAKRSLWVASSRLFNNSQGVSSGQMPQAFPAPITQQARTTRKEQHVHNTHTGNLQGNEGGRVIMNATPELTKRGMFDVSLYGRNIGGNKIETYFVSPHDCVKATQRGNIVERIAGKDARMINATGAYSVMTTVFERTNKDDLLREIAGNPVGFTREVNHDSYRNYNANREALDNSKRVSSGTMPTKEMTNYDDLEVYFNEDESYEKTGNISADWGERGTCNQEYSTGFKEDKTQIDHDLDLVKDQLAMNPYWREQFPC